MSSNISIQMELNFHKINVFFHHFIITSNVEFLILQILTTMIVGPSICELSIKSNNMVVNLMIMKTSCGNYLKTWICVFLNLHLFKVFVFSTTKS
jgi:hypothetical protein